MQNKPVTDIIGTVSKAYPINQNIETGAWRPANFSIETESGVRFIKQFPLSYWDKETSAFVTPDPIRMPEWYNNLIATYGENLMGLVGLRIKVRGEGKINSHSMEIEYTVAEGSFTVLQGEPKQDSEDAPPPPVQHTVSLDERIAWNSAINNAISALPFGKFDGEFGVGMTFKPSDNTDQEKAVVEKWIEEIDTVARVIYSLIRRGPVEPEVEAVEPDEFESLGSI